MTHLFTLPNELLLLIAENLRPPCPKDIAPSVQTRRCLAYLRPPCPTDIASLIQTSRRLAYLLTPLLHQLALSGSDESQGILLRRAVRYGYFALVKLLVDHGRDPNSTDGMGGTPLHLAARYGREAIMRLLIEKGADIDALDVSDDMPIHLATHEKQSAAIQILIDCGARLNDFGSGGTPLQWATRYGNAPLVQLILGSGKCDVNTRDYDEKTPLHWAAGGDSVAVAQSILDSGGYVDSRDDRGETPLHYAARNWNVLLAKLMLDNGSDVNCRSYSGDSPLHAATQESHEEDIHKDTTPRYSSWNWPEGEMKIIKLLLSYGADVTLINRGGDTATTFASGDVRELLEGGAWFTERYWQTEHEMASPKVSWYGGYLKI